MISTHGALALVAAVLAILGVGCFMSGPVPAKETAEAAPGPARAAQPKIPALDRAAPAEVATATFAMG